MRHLDPAAAVAFGVPASAGGVVPRAQAMQVPAVRRARSLIAGTIGTLPLVAWRDRAGQVESVDRLLLSQLDPSTTPAYTITWTVDDLLFYGVSWWRVTNRDSTGYPCAVEWLRRDRLTVDVGAQAVYVDGHRVDDAELIRFDGPDGGLLVDGSPTIRIALALMQAARRTADDDWSGVVLRLAEGADELTGPQIDELQAAWEDAKRRRQTPYLNRAVEVESVGYSGQQRQLTELVDSTSSELARLCNLPASRIGAPQGSGMTYANTESDRRDLVDTTLALYLTPLWQRLSLPDVTPAGQRVAVDLTAYLRGSTSELVTAGVAATAAGFTTPAEVRTRWLGLPPLSAPLTPTESVPNL